MIHHHLILPNELNHEGTLFGGTAMSAADKAAYIEAALAFPKASFVTKATEGFNFISPAKTGDILEIITTIIEVGNTSLKIAIQARNAKTKTTVFVTKFTFVHVENGHSAPIPEKDAHPGVPQSISGTYTNWKQETGRRTIIPNALNWASSKWHPKPQWLLTALDTDSWETREFALQDFSFTTLPKDFHQE